jgi:hypothetical protein
MRLTRIHLLLAAAVALCGIAPRAARAQALPTATGAGAFTALGVGISGFPSDYDGRNLGGFLAYAEIQPEWHFGFEAEARKLIVNTDESVDQANYLFGVRTAVNPGGIHPYVKFLAGATTITAPFHYGKGTFFTYAPGAGVEAGLGPLRWRVIDVEYQMTPNFIGSSVRNFGISTGVSIRITRPSRLPDGARFRGH